MPVPIPIYKQGASKSCRYNNTYLTYYLTYHCGYSNMYRKLGQGKKRSGRSLSFGPEWDGMGDRSQSVVMVVPFNHRCDNCVRTYVRLSVAGPAGGDREEKFER